MLPHENPEKLPSWNLLKAKFETVKDTLLHEFFEEDRNYLRFSWEDFFVDYSKNHVNREILDHFEQLLLEVDFYTARDAMFSGQHINQTENRAVLHTALRRLQGAPVIVEGNNITEDIKKELRKIEDFTDKLHSGHHKGYTGRPITDIVNIGIGGSDLGPLMVSSALKPYWKEITPHFVSNVDASDILEKISTLDPETTLFIIASKTFSTQETMTNAQTAKNWFLKSGTTEDIKKHFVAVSTNQEKVTAFGIDPNNMFIFWDWVGGRYSLWSAIGLSIACAVGYEHFYHLLRGAEKMDEHFRTAPFRENIPLLMACIGIWYNNFFGSETHAILPYDHRLSHLSRYLQQGDMESNGKYIDRDGNEVNYQTGQIIWGEPGTNGQHAFYQLIHQGTKLIPADFIACAKAPHDLEDHQQKLLANFFAQTEALMKGKSREEARRDLEAKGLDRYEIEKILPFKVFKGNKPTNSILIKELTPENLGALIAIYEHKIFVQGIVWNIFSFDQWGVELGKQLAGNVLPEIKQQKIAGKHDSSTKSLLEKYFEFSRG